MFRIPLCLTIILLCSLIGYLKSLKYSERVCELQDYIYVLREMDAEMSYRLTPLQDVFAGLSEGYSGKHSKALHFFSLVAENLAGKSRITDNPANMDMAQAWVSAFETECSKMSALTGDDKAIVLEFGRGLGCTGIANQRNRFEYTLDRLSRQLDDAKSQAAGKGMMAKKIGVLMGIAAAILII